MNFASQLGRFSEKLDGLLEVLPPFKGDLNKACFRAETNIIGRLPFGFSKKISPFPELRKDDQSYRAGVWRLPYSTQQGFVLYKAHQIERAAAGEPSLFEYGRFGEWLQIQTVIFLHINLIPGSKYDSCCWTNQLYTSKKS